MKSKHVFCLSARVWRGCRSDEMVLKLIFKAPSSYQVIFFPLRARNQGDFRVIARLKVQMMDGRKSRKAKKSSTASSKATSGAATLPNSYSESATSDV